MTYLVIVLIKKITTIDEPYTKLKAACAQYDAKPTYAKRMFTSLLFCPKSKFLSKGSLKKGVKMIYFVIFLADISATVNNPYTEFVLLFTNCIA
jgi:hypothetical protein